MTKFLFYFWKILQIVTDKSLFFSVDFYVSRSVSNFHQYHHQLIVLCSCNKNIHDGPYVITDLSYLKYMFGKNKIYNCILHTDGDILWIVKFCYRLRFVIGDVYVLWGDVLLQLTFCRIQLTFCEVTFCYRWRFVCDGLWGDLCRGSEYSVIAPRIIPHIWQNCSFTSCIWRWRTQILFAYSSKRPKYT